LSWPIRSTFGPTHFLDECARWEYSFDLVSSKVQHHKHLSTKKLELDSFPMRSMSKAKEDVFHCGQPFGPVDKCPEKGMGVMILHSCLKMKTWLRTGRLSKLKGEMTSRNSHARGIPNFYLDDKIEFQSACYCYDIREREIVRES